jgi:uncharacterized membrane protein YfcA
MASGGFAFLANRRMTAFASSRGAQGLHIISDMLTFWIALSAILAGVMNAVAGGGTLLTFPALSLLAGLTAQAANVTSTTALMPGSMASAWGYREELEHCRRWVGLLTIPSLLGGTIGALLLICLDEKYFRVVVPWLVLLAATLFLLQPYLARWIMRHQPAGPAHGKSLAIILIAQFLIAIYGGYFGAGIGILMLSSLGFLGLANIHQMNALKSFLALCINGISVVFFMFSGQIHWVYAGIMTIAAILGGYFGARASLLLKPIYVRWIVITIGFGLAGYFFYQQRG